MLIETYVIHSMWSLHNQMGYQVEKVGSLATSPFSRSLTDSEMIPVSSIFFTPNGSTTNDNFKGKHNFQINTMQYTPAITNYSLVTTTMLVHIVLHHMEQFQQSLYTMIYGTLNAAL